MGSERHVCPACGQPVETVVRRHKTLGAWVPLWVAGPCRNPECGAYDAEDASGSDSADGDTGDSGEDARPPAEDRPPEDDRPAGVTAPPAESPPAPAPGGSAAKKP
jgi:hypothetical protein